MKNNQLKILIADEQPIVRIGLRTVLKDTDGFTTAGEAQNGRELLEMVNSEEIDLVVMDVSYPDMEGSALLTRLLAVKEHIAVLILSMHTEEEMILEMLQAGARGYVIKTAGHRDLIQALQAVARGQSYFSPEVSSKLLPRIVRPDQGYVSGNHATSVSITPREREILKLICQEFTNPEIAERLNISRRTVDTHRKNLLHKTGARNTVGLIKFALRKGVINH